MSGALKDFKLAYTFKSLRQTCALEDFDTVWRARVEVYINATGEFSACTVALNPHSSISKDILVVF